MLGDCVSLFRIRCVQDLRPVAGIVVVAVVDNLPLRVSLFRFQCPAGDNGPVRRGAVQCSHGMEKSSRRIRKAENAPGSWRCCEAGLCGSWLVGGLHFITAGFFLPIPIIRDEYFTGTLEE